MVPPEKSQFSSVETKTYNHFFGHLDVIYVEDGTLKITLKKKNCVDESHGQCSSVLHTFFIFVLIISRRVLYICFNENKTLLTKKVHYEVNCGWFLCALSIKMPLTKRKIKLNFNLNITDSIYTTFHFKLYSWSLKIKLKFEKGIMSVSLVQRQWLAFFRKESVTSLAFSTSFRKMSLVSISFCFY